MDRATSLRVRRRTRNQLAEIGRKDETFDEIIQRLIEFHNKNSKRRTSRKEWK